MTIGYKPSFVREFKKLPPDLQADALDKIEMFKDSGNHKRLKVHKLKGKLGNYHSFSVTYYTELYLATHQRMRLCF